MSRLQTFLGELIWFFQPIGEATENGTTLMAFFREFGYAPDNAVALNDVNEIRGVLQPAIEAASKAVSDGAPDISDAQALFSAIQDIVERPAVQAVVVDTQKFAEDLFAYLLYRYVSTRLLSVGPVLKALGVVTVTRVNTSDANGRDVDYDRVELHWNRLGDFVRDNGKWARDVYGWGATQAADGRIFDYQLAIAMLANVLESTQLAFARGEVLPAAEVDAFLANRGNTEVNQIVAPVYQEEFESVNDYGDPLFQNEIGLKVVPSGDLSQPAGLGLALAPFARGNLAAQIDLTESLALRLEAAGRAADGVFYLRLSPDGIEVVQGDPVEASFEFGFTYKNADDPPKPMVLLGEEGTTRVELGSVLGSVGGNLSGDFFLAGGAKGLRAVIDVSDDGFLGAIVPDPINIEVGTILLGWRTGRGVYFDGGSSLSVTVPLDLPLGPISIYELGLLLDWEDNLAVTVLITADATLGPLFAYVENAGLEVTLVPVPSGDGLLGKYNLEFGFVPPTGYAAALDAAPIAGGGFLSVQEHEYRGALALQFETFGFAAFGILNTQLPGGRDGFSLAASIFGEFTVPLGYGFFLTGVGGVIGINRTIDTDALRAVLYEGRMDSILFPSDPITNARTILQDMADILQPRNGQHLFGPVARISWGQPNLVDVKLGLVLEVGTEIRILILGGLGSNLPTRDAALIALNMSFFGEIDFAASTISFDASLEGSRVLTFAISGDSAIRTGWKPGIPTVASFGGLHPQYPRPANLPELRRMSINFGTNNPKITLSAYQAITLNSLQFGASATLYAKGPKIWLLGQLAAEGDAYFNALIYFNPFAFDAELGGSLALLVDGDTVAGLGFSLRLTGPNTFVINGKVWVTVMGQDIDFRIRHTWGNRQSLPDATVNAVAELRRVLGDNTVFDPVTPRGRSVGVTFRDADDVDIAVDPIGGLRYVERAMPLGIKIEKIGEARIVGADRMDIEVLKGGAVVDVAPAEQEFVRGHFFALTEAEQLRSPAFESYKAGFEMGAEDLVMHAEDPFEAEYDYEVIEIEEEDDRYAPFSVLAHGVLSTTFATRFMAATHEIHFRPCGSLPDILAPPVPVVVADNGFVSQATASYIDAAAAMDVTGFLNTVALQSTLTQAVGVGLLHRDTNDAVSDYVAAARFVR